MIQDSCVYSSVPAEAVTIAILNNASFHSFCCHMNKKVNSFTQTVFLLEQHVVSKVTSSSHSAAFSVIQACTRFCHVLTALLMIRFFQSLFRSRDPQISAVKSLLLLW